MIANADRIAKLHSAIATLNLSPKDTSALDRYEAMLQELKALEAPAIQFADAAETLAHLELMYSVYGSPALTVWITAEGKHIDSTVLEALVAEGSVRRSGGNGGMWSTPNYYLVV